MCPKVVFHDIAVGELKLKVAYKYIMFLSVRAFIKYLLVSYLIYDNNKNNNHNNNNNSLRNDYIVQLAWEHEFTERRCVQMGRKPFKIYYKILAFWNFIDFSFVTVAKLVFLYIV